MKYSFLMLLEFITTLFILALAIYIPCFLGILSAVI